MIAENKMKPGYAVEDGVALHFVDEQLHMSVSSRIDRKAYFVNSMEYAVQELEISTKYLG